MSGEYSTATLTAHFRQVNERLRNIEAQLALVSGKLGLAFDVPGTGVPADVVDLARAGDILGAVKRYREITGVGFEEARDVVTGI